ncbi:MAG: choice-of-anchor Q domain-containing protein [Candidatus Udaeobacter sp.]
MAKVGSSASKGFAEVGNAFPVSIIVVTNTNDNGPGSLRNALAIANDGDTIDATGVSGTILLTSGELQINHNVTINGPGAGTLAVNGNAASRVFENFGSDVTISGFTVTNGLPPTGDNNGGGGILNHGGLTLSGTSILSNNAGGFLPPNAGGGGIGISAGGTLTVTNSVIGGNESQNGPGGGISAGGTMTVSNSTINNNEGLCTGGGIAFNDIGGTLTVMNSTIIGNSVLGCPVSGDGVGVPTGGGGVACSGSVTVINSTISGNTVAVGGVPTGGGGIACSGSMTVINSTISGNTVGGTMPEGGGIRNGGALTLTNSTLSGNSVPSGQGGAISNAGQTTIGDTVLNAGASGGTIFNSGGAITSLGYNIASDNGGGVLTGPGDQINIDPMLGPLQDNGGPTFTHALLPGSPAIDTGDPNFTPPPLYDQRGPGYSRIVNGRIDKGSFEVQSGGTPTPTPTSTPTATRTPTATATPTATPVATATPTVTASPTPTTTGTPSITPRPAPTPRPRPTPAPRP